jgi:HEAT repeat protein
MDADQNKADVRAWLRKAPFDDPAAQAAQPDFSYEAWIEEGKKLPRVVDALMELLEDELSEPSGAGERLAYALGWMGDRRAVAILTASIESQDPNLRVEAVAALGRLGDESVFDKLRQLLEDESEDPNVRANAAIAIGRLGAPESQEALKRAARSSNPFIAASAEEGLRLLGGTDSPRR